MESKIINKAIFLDRDGVINKEVNYLHKIDSFIFLEGIFDSCKHFISLGYVIIVITNQSGIARGYYSQNDYQKLTNWMLNEFKKNGISILDIFHCPHSPKVNCDCRKPKPGMFLLAKKIHNIKLAQSWMIGDKETDIQAANNAGIVNTILLESGHEIKKEESNAKFILKSINLSKNIINT
jgi:D-glycero-D-manno-heptose 1,7-bisphosphate phosphatase